MLYDEDLLTFSEAAKNLPTIDGRRAHASTIWRWARKGIQGVKLETLRVGGRFVTSAEALERFSRKLAELPPGAASSSSTRRVATRPRSATQRQHEIERANEYLKKEGL